MATRLTIKFSAEAFEVLAAEREQSNVAPRVAVEASWFEAVKVGDETIDTVPRSVRIESAGSGEVAQEIGTPLNEVVTVAVLKSDGTASSVHRVQVAQGAAEYTLTAKDIETLLQAESVPLPSPTMRSVRNAQLVPIGSVRPDFTRSTLAIFAVRDARELEANEPLGAFGFTQSRSSAVELTADAAGKLGNLRWNTVHVGIDGRFTATFDQPVSACTVRI